MHDLKKTLDTLDLVIDDVMRIDAKRGLEVRAVLAANRALNEARDTLYALAQDRGVL